MFFIERNLLCSVFDGETVYLLEKQEDTRKIPDLSKIINICVESKNKNISDILTFYQKAEAFTSCEVHQNNWYVDIVPQNISKAFAIHFITNLEVLNKSHQLAAVGDSWNDIPMFVIADESYTFHQSPIEVKQKATHHIDHVYQCVADFLER
ncbi:MAG: HAD family hydrolase [Beduini sp.]|uniref:HAD family hydrolase n=1 Tax=Beduini sp. TaxID=1922300 RepID=UPI0039905887